MPGPKKKTSNLAFKAGVLATFGKLDEQDIEDIDGCSELLVTNLIDRYGWSPAYAKTKVDEFYSNLQTPPIALTSGQSDN